MSYLENSPKWTVKTCQFPDEKGYLAKKVSKYNRKHSHYVDQLTKTIKEIEKYYSKIDFITRDGAKNLKLLFT